MLSLRIASTHLPLPKEFALGFNFITNVLNISEKVEPSFSLPITVPNTEEVSELFGYGHESTSDFDLSQTFEDCAVMLDGNDYWPGAIEIASGDDDEFKLNFRFASGYIPTVNEKQTLKELFEDVAINITGGTVRTYIIPWPTDLKSEYKLTINGTLYAETVVGVVDGAEDYLNALAAQADGHADVSLATMDYDLQYGPIDPASHFMTIVATANTTLTLVAQHVLDLEGGGVETVTIDAITVHPAMELSFPELGNIYELPTMYIPNLFDGNAPDFCKFVNLYNGGKYYYNFPTKPEELTTAIIPCIRNEWMLNYLFSLFGIEIQGSYLLNNDLAGRFEFTPRGIEKEIYDNLGDVIDIDIAVSEFLPDITLSDWLLSLKAEACTSITFDSGNKVASLNLLNSVLPSVEYDDWTGYLVKMGRVNQEKYAGVKIGYTLANDDLRIKEWAKIRETFSSINDPVADFDALVAITTDDANAVRLVISRNAFYKWTLILGDSTYAWVFYAYNIDDYIDGDEVLDVRSKYCPLVDDLLTYDDRWESTMRLPYADVIGYMPQMGLDKNKFPPRFGIYRGLQEDLLEEDYPMASIGIHKADETAIDGATLCLSPAVHPANKTDLLFAEWILQQKDNKRFTATFNLPLGMLEKINPIKKIRVRDVNFLVESHSGEIKRGGLNLVESILIRT